MCCRPLGGPFYLDLNGCCIVILAIDFPLTNSLFC